MIPVRIARGAHTSLEFSGGVHVPTRTFMSSTSCVQDIFRWTNVSGKNKFTCPYTLVTSSRMQTRFSAVCHSTVQTPASPRYEPAFAGSSQNDPFPIKHRFIPIPQMHTQPLQNLLPLQVPLKFYDLAYPHDRYCHWDFRTLECSHGRPAETIRCDENC